METVACGDRGQAGDHLPQGGADEPLEGMGAGAHAPSLDPFTGQTLEEGWWTGPDPAVVLSFAITASAGGKGRNGRGQPGHMQTG